MKILLPAQFDNFSNRKDKSLTLRFITQEVTAEKVAEIHRMIDSFGYLYFKGETMLTPNEIRDIEDLDTEVGGKSLSKRLMNTLYIYWEQNDTSYDDFKDFYKHRMETNIQKIKDQLI